MNYRSVRGLVEQHLQSFSRAFEFMLVLLAVGYFASGTNNLLYLSVDDDGGKFRLPDSLSAVECEFLLVDDCLLLVETPLVVFLKVCADVVPKDLGGCFATDIVGGESSKIFLAFVESLESNRAVVVDVEQEEGVLGVLEYCFVFPFELLQFALALLLGRDITTERNRGWLTLVLAPTHGQFDRYPLPAFGFELDFVLVWSRVSLHPCHVVPFDEVAVLGCDDARLRTADEFGFGVPRHLLYPVVGVDYLPVLGDENSIVALFDDRFVDCPRHHCVCIW